MSEMEQRSKSHTKVGNWSPLNGSRRAAGAPEEGNVVKYGVLFLSRKEQKMGQSRDGTPSRACFDRDF